MVQYNVSPTFAELVGVPVALSVRSFDVTENEGVISSASVAGKLEKKNENLSTINSRFLEANFKLLISQ